MLYADICCKVHCSYCSGQISCLNLITLCQHTFSVGRVPSVMYL